MNDRELWRNAHTLEDLGNLTADWLEGTNGHQPGYYPDPDGTSRPDSETAEIIEYLVRANRNGYVTTFSQPARAFTGGGGQRAAVDGFCSEETADRIQAAILGTPLIAIATPGGWDNPTQIPVTIDEHEAFTWVGANTGPEDISGRYGDDCPGALVDLAIAWQVAILDPEWGRIGLLWERLDLAWE